MEHDGLSAPSSGIRGDSCRKARANHLAHISHKRRAGGLEEVNIPSLISMLQDCQVPLRHPHVAALALAGVLKDPFVGPAVLVAVSLARSAREDKDYRIALGRAYAALPLPSVLLVQRATSVSSAPNEHGGLLLLVKLVGCMPLKRLPAWTLRRIAGKHTQVRPAQAVVDFPVIEVIL